LSGGNRLQRRSAHKVSAALQFFPVGVALLPHFFLLGVGHFGPAILVLIDQEQVLHMKRDGLDLSFENASDRQLDFSFSPNRDCPRNTRKNTEEKTSYRDFIIEESQPFTP
jgi:hypothetical protein